MLNEMNEQAPGGGMHRYQVIRVVRDGILSEWRKDMGLVSKWKGVKQLRIPSFNEHTVDELMDLADYLRSETELDIKDFLELDKMILV